MADTQFGTEIVKGQRHVDGQPSRQAMIQTRGEAAQTIERLTLNSPASQPRGQPFGQSGSHPTGCNHLSLSLCPHRCLLSLSMIVRHLQNATRRPHKLAGHLRRWGGSSHAASQPSSPANLLASSEETPKKQSESLANQPARSQANNYPPDQPTGQSNSQSAIRMPFKHLFLPAMRLSPSRFRSPLPPCPSLYLSLAPFQFRSLPLSPIVRQLQGVARRTHKVAANWSSRNLGRWQGRPANLQRMRARLCRQAGRQAGRQPSKQRQAAEKHRDGLGRHAVIQKAYKN